MNPTRRRIANENGEVRRGLIVSYHRVSAHPTDPWCLSVTPEHFAEHLEVLRERCAPTRLRELSSVLVDPPVGQPPVVVTFDDGYADNLHTAKPLLEQARIPATVFLATGRMGQRRELWWDELDGVLLQAGELPESLSLSIEGKSVEWRLDSAADYPADAFWRDHTWKIWESPPTARQAIYLELHRLCMRLSEDERQSLLDQIVSWAGGSPTRPSHRLLSEQEAAALPEGGLVEVGAHTVTHPMLSALPMESQREEIQGSKAWLENLLGRQVTAFAYPFGKRSNYTRDTVALVSEAGFKCACSSFGGVVEQGTDQFQLPRIQVTDWPGEEFSRRVSVWLSEG